MVAPAVPFLAAGAIGALLGGGSQTTQSQDFLSSISNAFNPTIVFGGDSSFTPNAPVNNDFNAVTAQSQTQEQANPEQIGALLGQLAGPNDFGAALAQDVLGSALGSSSVSGNLAPNGANAFAPSSGSKFLVPSLLAGAVGVGFVAYSVLKDD